MKVIAIKERSYGDGEGHGSNWVETAIFDQAAPLSAVLEWARMQGGDDTWRAAVKHGRLMLTIADESGEETSA